jgi:DNA replication protein DnaC
MRALPLRQSTPLPQTARCFSHLPRELGAVQPKLLDIFRQLVGGSLPWPFFLYGPPSTGKTSAALALLDHVPGGVYLTAPDLALRHHKEKWGKGPAIPWGPLTAGRCPLLVLDEIGVIDKTIGDSNYLPILKAVDCRTTWPLIVISNLGLDELAVLPPYDARIQERIGAGCQYKLDGDSRRMA